MTDYSPPYAMSTYLVLAVRSKANPDVQSCLYFTWAGLPVDSDNLQSCAQGYDSAFICLQQATLKELHAIRPIELAEFEPVDDVRLFAAVAKTRDQSDQLSTLFDAVEKDGRWTLVLPVFSGSSRSVILVFADSVGRLIASSDPEIKNSTGR